MRLTGRTRAQKILEPTRLLPEVDAHEPLAQPWVRRHTGVEQLDHRAHRLAPADRQVQLDVEVHIVHSRAAVCIRRRRTNVTRDGDRGQAESA
jgi:hypothetical protein